MEKEFPPKATIYDIAKEVGTSTATVSRVLSNSNYPVKKELREKIINVANKLEYSPNMVGRMLKKSESRDIGVVIPTITNPFYPHVVLGIEQEARNRGYSILLCNSLRSLETERKYIESLYQKQVKGIIISSVDSSFHFLNRMQERGMKLAIFDQDIKDLNCSKVGFDYLKGGFIATEYLLKMGHKNIAFMGSPLTKMSRQEVFEGYKLAHTKNGVEVRDEFIILSDTEDEVSNGTYEFENGKQLAARLLKQIELPSAIFAINDMTAFGIIQELTNHGVKVPGNISVIGFDNIEVSSMINPPLTTIDQPAFYTGQQVCRMLIDNMEGKEKKDITLTLEPGIVERNSCKKVDN